MIAATLLLRWPGLEKQIWNVDEAVTFTMTQQILAGEIPYPDAVDQRNPLAPYAQAVVFAVAGAVAFFMAGLAGPKARLET